MKKVFNYQCTLMFLGLFFFFLIWFFLGGIFFCYFFFLREIFKIPQGNNTVKYVAL